MRREDIKHIIEAVMFAYAEPISIKELNDIINEELASKEIEYMLNNLINEYKENNRGIQIKRAKGGESRFVHIKSRR